MRGVVEFRMVDLETWKSRGVRIEDDSTRVQFLSALEFIEKLDLEGFEKLADIGSGPGHQAFIFKRLGCDVTCVDYKRPIYANLVWTHPDNADFHETFDLLWSHHCLEHIRDPLGALIQWWGWLKPGGRLLLTVPEIGLVMSSGHINSYNIPLLIYHLAMAGFSLAGKTIQKQRSHLRVIAQKSSNYDPRNNFTASLRDLADYSLFSPSVMAAIKKTGRFTAEDVHLHWLGQKSTPPKGTIATYDYIINAMWKG